MAKKNETLPNEIFVYRELDTDDSSWLNTFDSLEEAAESAGEKTLIGSYILDHTGIYAIEKTVTEL